MILKFSQINFSDISAAFDTIDHDILIKRLQWRIGVDGTALAWFDGYHRGRTQRVTIEGMTSDAVALEYGGPQGSLMGAEDYKVYTLPVGDIIRKHGLRFKIYADDTQLKIAFDVRNQTDLTNKVSKIVQCVQDIKSWMSTNKLKLNAEKTEVMVITAPHFSEKVNTPEVVIDGVAVAPVKAARNIGVLLDNTMSLSDHITAVCQSCMYHLRNISSIRKYITKEACECLVHAMVTSRIDYANSTLVGLPNSEISRLQRIQNMAARVVFRRPRYDHVTPLMRELHWLPIRERIHFKILIMAYKAIHGIVPGYIQELLILKVPPRTLRSNTSPNLLVVPRYNSERFGGRAFSNIAPRMWNALPPHIRAEKSFDRFKKQVKSYLFRHVYIN